MIRFKTRRIIGYSIVLSFAVVFAITYFQMEWALVDSSVYSGLLLLAMVLFLASYNLRKKLSFFDIGTSAQWLQIHIYVGWTSMLVFLLHLEFRFPQGGLEQVLGTLYALVALSGVLGAVLSRVIPNRLTANGGSITFEEIPSLRANLQSKAHQIALESINETKKTTVADFYTYRLIKYFQRANNFWFHLLGSRRHMGTLDTSFAGVKRYLSEKELPYLEQLHNLTMKKDTLDFQHSLQKVLKYWLFIHIPLTYSLVVFAIFHGLWAWRFMGG